LTASRDGAGLPANAGVRNTRRLLRQIERRGLLVRPDGFKILTGRQLPRATGPHTHEHP
jgi:hypothetical protein